MERVEE
jgi:hypothetical protein